MSPDCRDGKHAACVGEAFDERTDEVVDCTCQCHTYARDTYFAMGRWPWP